MVAAMRHLEAQTTRLLDEKVGGIVADGCGRMAAGSFGTPTPFPFAGRPQAGGPCAAVDTVEFFAAKRKSDVVFLAFSASSFALAGKKKNHYRPTEVRETGRKKAVRLHGLNLPQGKG